MPLAHVAFLLGYANQSVLTRSCLRWFGKTPLAMRDELNAAGLALDTLSMGMSDDLEAAIAEGSTLVRVGTAIFGSRR
mgnify:CR=1 FL=1